MFGEGNSVGGENQNEKATSLNMLLLLLKFEICECNTINFFSFFRETA